MNATPKLQPVEKAVRKASLSIARAANECAAAVNPLLDLREKRHFMLKLLSQRFMEMLDRELKVPLEMAVAQEVSAET